MARLFLWLLRLFTALAVLGIVTLVAGYFFLSRSLPDYAASYTLPGITAPVEVVRDNASVPHIFAQTDSDAFYALGFAHAQDRLWQMSILRRTAQGRLSEVFGAQTLATDELMRRLDIYGLALQSVSAQSPETLAALEAYARGVNAWVDIVNSEARGRGAPEFFFFSNEFAVWQPADSIAIVKLLALQQTGQLDAEVLRARVSLVLPDARLADILPDAPGRGIAALPDYAEAVPADRLPPPLGPAAAPLPTGYAALVPGVVPGLAAPPRPDDPYWPVPPRDLAGASNAWAAAPARSAAGGSLLANDPHLPFTAPSLWYLARLQLRAGGVIGATVPGVPLVMAGRNEAMAWGITSSYLDDQDLFVERLNPDNPEQYQTPDGWADFRTRRTIINVADAAPVTLTLRWTDNGPVLPGQQFGLAAVTPPGHVMALSWTALDGQDTTMTAGILAMSAQTRAEAIAAGALSVAPSQMLTLADREGVAMQMVGRMPRRNARHQGQGRLPSPGWEAANRWQGTLPYESNPRFDSPDSGIVANTNNKPLDRPFPLNVSFNWGDTQRIERLQGLMRAREVHTRESFIEAQLDTVSPTARTLLPLVAANLWFAGETAPEGTPERLRQRALAMLAEWNGDMNEHLAEPLIYSAWMRALQERLIRDELGPLADQFSRVEPLFVERVFVDAQGQTEGGAAVWCDVLQSSPVETCDEIARMALDDALLRLTERYGAIDSWRWGDAHQALQDHPVLGRVPLLGLLVNIRQSTSGDDQTLMRGMTRGTGPDPYMNVHGAGYRGVYDLADPDSSLFIISTGQSGHPLSRFYDDLSALWRRGDYIPMSLDPDQARAAAVGVTTLAPPPQ